MAAADVGMAEGTNTPAGGQNGDTSGASSGETTGSCGSPPDEAAFTDFARSLYLLVLITILTAAVT